MAKVIEGNIYRVSIDSERNFTYVSAKNKEDLIRFLVQELDDPSRVYGAKEINKDGSLTVVPIVTDPLFKQLSEKKRSRQTPKGPVRVTFLNGNPYAAVLPTTAMWETAIRSTTGMNSVLHMGSISSWGQESADLNAAGNIPDLNTIGYRPVLIPLDPQTLKPNSSRLSYIKDGSVFRMGALYMDNNALLNPGRPAIDGDIPDYVPNAKLYIGDADNFPLTSIYWIKTGDFLISDRVLLKNISWDDLNVQGLVFGREEEKVAGEKAGIDDLIRSAMDHEMREFEKTLSPEFAEKQHARFMEAIGNRKTPDHEH